HPASARASSAGSRSCWSSPPPSARAARRTRRLSPGRRCRRRRWSRPSCIASRDLRHGSRPEHMSELRVGTSGWQYKHWKGRFYPKDLPTAKWLDYYTRYFDTVELNNPFYRQPEKKTFEKWRRSVPGEFVYAVKLNRFITHVKRVDIERDSVERCYGTMAGLGPKLAGVLVERPPRRKFDPARTERVFR